MGDMEGVIEGDTEELSGGLLSRTRDLEPWCQGLKLQADGSPRGFGNGRNRARRGHSGKEDWEIYYARGGGIKNYLVTGGKKCSQVK